MPNSSRPTIKDVARVSGTSIKTVSRVLNREGTVSEDLTRRVEQAIADLGYRRDETARRLRSGDTRLAATIGLAVINLGDPFFAAIAEGVESVASERGALLVVGSHEASPGRQDEIVETLISHRVDGLIVVPVGGSLDLLESEIGRGTPIVFVDTEPGRPLGDVVMTDHWSAAESGVRHLVSAGHSRIAFLGLGDGVQSTRERREAYESVLASEGLEVDRALMKDGLFDPDDASLALEEMLDLDEPPTAVYAAYWSATVGAVRALRSRRLEHEVALVSSDDIEAGDLMYPGLTATRQDPYELGRSAAGLLFQRLDGHEGPPETIKMQAELVTRGSGEISPAPAARDS